MSAAEHTQVAVVGAGIVGATVACALASAGMRVLLLDAGPSPRWTPGQAYAPRVCAITQASAALLERVGAWQGVMARRVSSFRRIRAWEAGGGAVHFDAAQIGEPALGHIIENDVICTTLLERAGELAGLTYRSETAVEAVEAREDGVTLRLGNGETVQARLVVGADGAESVIRSQARIRLRGWDYAHTAIVADVRTTQPHGETAWQCFRDSGPLAFLPLADGSCSIVWSTSPERAERLLVLSEESFCAALTEELEAALGEVLETGKRYAFALRMRHAERYIAPRVALVGDAAHTIHPLAGQGVNLGLADAAALVALLLQSAARRRDVGGWDTLRRYERDRKGEILAMIAIMEGFKRLFGSRLPPLRWARSLGLDLTDHLLPVKALIMRRAMGLGGTSLASRDSGR